MELADNCQSQTSLKSSVLNNQSVLIKSSINHVFFVRAPCSLRLQLRISICGTLLPVSVSAVCLIDLKRKFYNVIYSLPNILRFFVIFFCSYRSATIVLRNRAPLLRSITLLIYNSPVLLQLHVVFSATDSVDK
jgi:hypothetical protein